MYTKEGKEWKGSTHKMPDGTVHTNKKHSKTSKRLYTTKKGEINKWCTEWINQKRKQSQPAIKRRIRVNQQAALKQRVKSINDYFNSLKGINDYFNILKGY